MVELSRLVMEVAKKNRQVVIAANSEHEGHAGFCTVTCILANLPFSCHQTTFAKRDDDADKTRGEEWKA